MTSQIFELEPISIEETLELIPEALKTTYQQMPYINWEKAKEKYKYEINWSEISSILQFYISTRLTDYTEKDLKERVFTIEIPEEMVSCMSYINQLSLVFRKGDSLFSVSIDRYRKLTIHHLGDAYHDSLTWFYDIKDILCTEGVVKDKNYCEFWGISNDYQDV